MNLYLRSSVFSVTALLAASTLSATPTGFLSITNVTNGGVAVSATRIDWYPTTNPVGMPAGTGDFATGGFTSIDYSGGTLTATTNPYGQIKDLDVSTPSVANFIQFYAGASLPTPPGTGTLQSSPVFDLVSVAPGGAAQGALSNCEGITGVGQSCSPLVSFGGTTFVSPFVLTNRGAYTDVSLGVNLLGRDSTGAIAWAGGFTTQVTVQDGVRLTPDAIQRIINSGGAITNTYSGTFSASAVPEPASLALIGSGFCLIAFLRRRVAR